MIKLPLENAKAYINEGDVLLFRGNSWFSHLLGMVGFSTYTHVAVASWHDKKNNFLECVEFKEWIGGRSVNLEVVVQENPELIDVYRPSPYIIQHYYYNCRIFQKVKKFNGNLVTQAMRKLTGLPYGWIRIWWMAQFHIPFLRMFKDISYTLNDESKDVVYPVCSTAVAHAFSSSSYDLVNNKSDEWTEPADIARSKLLSYLFTLC